MLIQSLVFLILVSFAQLNSEFCFKQDENCGSNTRNYLFYDVNPPEGFNLRRDVYMRFAIMLAETQKSGKHLNWDLVLPPWHRLYHWTTFTSEPLPWSSFFDLDSLKSYAPVVELYELVPTTSTELILDTIYVLKNYRFDGEDFSDKWEMDTKDCKYDGNYWGYKNISAKEIICVYFQGRISMLWEIITQYPIDKKIMIAHGEIPLHDHYGTKSFWDCRKSMKFAKNLVEAANKYIEENLECKMEKCLSYIGIHWRRRDFTYSRKKDVPSIPGTVKQIKTFIQKHDTSIKKVYVATDAPDDELKPLIRQLKEAGLVPFNNSFKATNFNDGQKAIIDQIICSHAAFFIGTHESTFTFRIQEEREILGFSSDKTFNRLCPDQGECEKPSKWVIIH